MEQGVRAHIVQTFSSITLYVTVNACPEQTLDMISDIFASAGPEKLASAALSGRSFITVRTDSLATVESCEGRLLSRVDAHFDKGIDPKTAEASALGLSNLLQAVPVTYFFDQKTRAAVPRPR